MVSMPFVVGANGMKKALFPRHRKDESHRPAPKKEEHGLTGTQLHVLKHYEQGGYLGRKFVDPRNGKTVLLIGQVDKIVKGVVVEFKTVRKKKNIKKQIRLAKLQVLCYCYLARVNKYRIVIYDTIQEQVIKVIKGTFNFEKFVRMVLRALDSMEHSGRRLISSRELKKHNTNRKPGRPKSEKAWVLGLMPLSYG